MSLADVESSLKGSAAQPGHGLVVGFEAVTLEEENLRGERADVAISGPPTS